LVPCSFSFIRVELELEILYLTLLQNNNRYLFIQHIKISIWIYVNITKKVNVLLLFITQGSNRVSGGSVRYNRYLFILDSNLNQCVNFTCIFVYTWLTLHVWNFDKNPLIDVMYYTQDKIFSLSGKLLILIYITFSQI
jgi:hypothetical protein